MALQASLVLSGDEDGARAALASAEQGMDAAEAQAQKLAAAFNRADSTIKRLAVSQADAKRETDQTKAAFKAGEISLVQYNQELLETKSALSLVAAEHRQAMAAVKRLSAANDSAGRSFTASNDNIGKVGKSSQLAGHHVQNLAFQFQDVTTGLLTGQPPMQVFLQQGGQIAGIMQQANIGVGGLAKSVFGMTKRFIPAAVAIGAGTLSLSLWNDKINEQADNDAFVKSLGLTKKEMEELGDTSVTIGDMMLGTWDVVSGAFEDQFGESISAVGEWFTDMFWEADEISSSVMNNIIGYGVGTYNGIVAVWGKLPDAASDIFTRAVNSGIEAFNALIQAHVDGLNFFVDAANDAFDLELPTISAPQIDKLKNEHSGAGAAAGAAYKEGFASGFGRDFVGEVRGAIADAATNRRDEGVRGEADEIIGERSGSSRAGRGRSRGLSEIEKFAKEAERAIEALNGQFAEQPTLMKEAADATAELDALIAELSQRKPPGFEQLISQAQEAKVAVEDALVRPFTELRQESERRQQIDILILSGREAEAAVLQEIWRLEETLGPLTEERRQEVEGIVLAEERHLDQLERAQRLQSAYLSATQSVRGELEALFSGQGDIGNFKQIFKDLQSKVLVEQLFGPALDDLDQFVKENSGIPETIDQFTTETSRASSASGQMADALESTAQRIAGIGAGDQAAGLGAIDGLGAIPNIANDNGGPANDNEIVVTGVAQELEQSNTALGLTPDEFMQRLSSNMAGSITDSLDEQFGTKFFGQFESALAGVFYGSATAGTTGGILGGFQGLVDEFGEGVLGGDLAKDLSDGLGKALGGAQGGTQIAGLGNLVGLNLSTSGAQFGGAAGSLIGGPVGGVIGSIAGGLLGSVFGSKSGSASITGVDSGISTSGKSDSRREAATSLAGSVQDGVASIAEALGGRTGAFNVSVGVRKDNFRLDRSGRGETKTSKGAIDFGNDQDGLINAAIADAIADGGVSGVSDAIQRALRSSSDVDEALREALAVQELEDIISDLGSEIGNALTQFEDEAKERLRLARQYGLDIVAVEELNAKERLALSERLLEDQVGSLQRLVDDLTLGNLAEGSAVDRRAALLREIDQVRADANAGEDGAADRLSDLLRQLDTVSREVFGSTGGFADDRSNILDDARSAIAAANQRIEQAQAQSDPALETTNAALDENNDQNAEIISYLRDLNIAFGRGPGAPPASGGAGFSRTGLEQLSNVAFV